jgi:hypothetical protein
MSPTLTAATAKVFVLKSLHEVAYKAAVLSQCGPTVKVVAL